MQPSHINTILTSATREVISGMFGIDATRQTSTSDLSSGFHGAKLPFRINNFTYEIGIVSDPQEAIKITNLMFGLEDETWSEEEIIDALGEIANLIAGRIKAMFFGDGICVELSTPQDLGKNSPLPTQLLEFKNSTIEFSVFMNAVQSKELALQ